jgi:hypothetical protein
MTNPPSLGGLPERYEPQVALRIVITRRALPDEGSVFIPVGGVMVELESEFLTG